MSHLEAAVAEASARLNTNVLLPREVPLGGPRALLVRRTLPHKERRMIGPWCFVDHYGPVAHAEMNVPPHPHTGLQTVSWLLSGAIEHTDSLGYRQTIKPGQLNLMTSGRAIAHAEESHGNELHGIQLWVALPEESRFQEPHFEHHDDLPTLALPGATIIVIMGEVAGVNSPALSYSPTVAAQITMTADQCSLPLQEPLEYGLLALDRPATVEGEALPAHALMDLGAGRKKIAIRTQSGARFLLIGGAPFEEEIVMFWNFIGRNHEEIAQMREDWQEQRGYTPVEYEGTRLPAPQLPLTRLKARKA